MVRFEDDSSLQTNKTNKTAKFTLAELLLNYERSCLVNWQSARFFFVCFVMLSSFFRCSKFEIERCWLSVCVCVCVCVCVLGVELFLEHDHHPLFNLYMNDLVHGGCCGRLIVNDLMSGDYLVFYSSIVCQKFERWIKYEDKVMCKIEDLIFALQIKRVYFYSDVITCIFVCIL